MNELGWLLYGIVAILAFFGIGFLFSDLDPSSQAFTFIIALGLLAIPFNWLFPSSAKVIERATKELHE